jgi:uncharacterized protein (TIGR02145 family)
MKTKLTTLALALLTAVAAIGQSGVTINGLDWANANVAQPGAFAAKPDMLTEFYQWNNAVAFTAMGSAAGWTSKESFDPDWTVNPCPNGWRLPTKGEFRALEGMGSTWAAASERDNAVAGRFYGPSHATATVASPQGGIFLSASGFLSHPSSPVRAQSTHGYYWSATTYTPNPLQGRFLVVEVPGSGTAHYVTKGHGLNLRCVRAPVAVTSVSLQPATLHLGQTQPLAPAFEPSDPSDQSVTWISDNENVATVDSTGLVTPKATGTTTITVTTVNNQTAICTLKVIGAVAVPVAAVSLGITDTSLEVDAPAQLTPAFEPNNATDQSVTWFSSNTSIAEVSETGLVTPKAAGTATITVTTVNDKTATRTLTWCNVLTPGGVCWADTNVAQPGTFAAKPDMYTEFYQWNRPGKAWPATGDVTEWNATADEAQTWTAGAPCPAGWRLPTRAEYEELDTLGGEHSNKGGKWYAAEVNGNEKPGRFYGPNAPTCSLSSNMKGCVFFPAAGYRSDTNGALSSQNTDGDYWSSTQDAGNTAKGHFLRFGSSGSSPSYSDFKTFGFLIRCVR